MAVYTPLTLSETSAWLEAYDLPPFVALHEIGAGIENSNFFVTTRDLAGTENRWVLTLFETLQADALPYFLQVLSWLQQQGFPVAAPLFDRQGQMLQSLKDKPAILVPCLPGRSLLQPDVPACAAMGKLLAHLHTVAAHVPVHRRHPRDATWLQGGYDSLRAVLPTHEAALLQDEIAHYESRLAAMKACPHGLVHGDLFRDNVLFEQGEVTGLIDFYHASDEVLLFDLAVVINDWATDGQGQYDLERKAALIQAYQSHRPWSDEEQAIWQDVLRLAALRFWVSRLQSKYSSGYQKRSTQGDATKNPDEFRNLLHTLRAAI